MKQQSILMILIVALFVVIPCASESAFAVSVVPQQQDIVNQVSQTTYSYYLDDMLYTHLGDNREWGPEHDLAQSNIYGEFESFGLSTSLHPFEYGGSTYYNVVGAHYGTVRPDDIYILGAHYDSVNGPGADDNASGVAGIMEAARVLSQYEFEATLIFIGFDREERGLIGSRAYAQDHKDDDILGMISLDMISYNGSGSDTARIYGRDSSAPLKESLADAISLYGNGLSSVDSGAIGLSDHEPFQEEGFQACLLIEYDVWNNPYYHRSYDSVDMQNYIDYAFATNMVRSTVGFLATSAVPILAAPVAQIPEPATSLLLSLGSLFLLRKRTP
jgi:Zn-dependent M28 family amino/carboxypeptidase